MVVVDFSMVYFPQINLSLNSLSYGTFMYKPLCSQCPPVYLKLYPSVLTSSLTYLHGL